ncbi:MAG: RNA-binding protein [Syntrophotaleaceae bacterium]
MARDVYVANIPFEATEEDLRNLFSVSGTVKSVRLLNDPRTGLFRGTAFVQMANAAEAKDAVVTLDGALLINRLISVSEARPKAPKPGAEQKPSKPSRRRPTDGRRK